MSVRCLPGLLDPGTPPLLASPDDVIAWVRTVEWLLFANRGLLLHLDDASRLSCIAAADSRLRYLGPAGTDALAFDALECHAAAVLAVDTRPKLTPKTPSALDARHHRQLGQHLALYGVALMDTVIVTPGGGVSVTGSVTYPSGVAPSSLQVHPPRRGTSPGETAHLKASSLPRSPERIGRTPLWMLRSPDDSDT